METSSAFIMGQLNRDKPSMVFDWDKAAKLIKERKPCVASAGLGNDWDWTGGIIFKDNKPITDDYTYLASTWAIPELDLDGEIIPCFLMKSKTEWDSSTKWPKSALDLL